MSRPMCPLRVRGDRPITARARSLGLVAAVGMILAGCGSGEVQIPTAPKLQVYPVKGKLVLPDGKPLTEGNITLVPEKQPGRGAAGKVQSDGSFTVKTSDQEEGAQEGDYRLFVASSLTSPGPKAGQKQPVVPIEYAPEDGLGLKISIKASPNDLGIIKLTPGATGAGSKSGPDGRDAIRD